MVLGLDWRSDVVLITLNVPRRSEWGGGPATADAGGHVVITRGGDGGTCNAIEVLFDNSYSWLTSKVIR